MKTFWTFRQAVMDRGNVTFLEGRGKNEQEHIIAILIAAILILNPFTLNYLKKQFVI